MTRKTTIAVALTLGLCCWVCELSALDSKEKNVGHGENGDAGQLRERKEMDNIIKKGTKIKDYVATEIDVRILHGRIFGTVRRVARVGADSKSCLIDTFLGDSATSQAIDQEMAAMKSIYELSKNDSGTKTLFVEEKDGAELIRSNTIASGGRLIVSNWFSKSSGFMTAAVFFDEQNDFYDYRDYVDVDFNRIDKFDCNHHGKFHKNFRLEGDKLNAENIRLKVESSILEAIKYKKKGEEKERR